MAFAKLRLRRQCAALVAVVAACCVAPAPVSAASTTMTVQANSVKTLTVAKVQDFNLGSITLGPGVWSNASVALARTGTLTCPAPNATCTGLTSVAIYNLQGSNQQTVRISAPNVILTNQSDPTKTLTLVADCQLSVVLPNSGQPGINVPVGGSVTISSTTVPGTYAGTFNFTADYQ